MCSSDLGACWRRSSSLVDVRGSRFEGPGSSACSLGGFSSRVEGQWSRVEGRGSRFDIRASRFEIPGLAYFGALQYEGRLSRAEGRLSRVEVGGSRLDVQCLMIKVQGDRKSTRLNSSHQIISYAVFCLKKKIKHFYRLSQGH